MVGLPLQRSNWKEERQLKKKIALIWLTLVNSNDRERELVRAMREVEKGRE